MLPKGTKVESPHVRATNKAGVIHAVARAGGEEGGKTLCGRSTLKADLPMKRFQQGLGDECVTCTQKVVNARLDAIKSRKALRSKKNQPGAETVVAKPVVTETNAKPSKATKPAAKKPAAKAKSNVTPISKAASKRPATKPKVAAKAAAAAKV